MSRLAQWLRLVRRTVLERTLQRMAPRRRRVLAWRAMLGTGVRELTFAQDGLVWTVAAEDEAIGFYLFTDGGYQSREIRALLAWMLRWDVLSGARDVVVDVGANIGSTCVPLVRAGGCRALAIEPVTENFRRLSINVQANGLAGRILLAQKAVLRAPGRIRMCLTAGRSGGNFVWRDGLADIAPEEVAGFEEVEGDSLVAIASAAGLGLEEIALVWADVQGCEAEVIESGAALWAHGVPLWAEVEPLSLRRQGSLASFADLAAAHFDRFVPADDLLRHGDDARAVPIAELGALIDSITPARCNVDVLFLPPGCPAQPLAPRA